MSQPAPITDLEGGSAAPTRMPALPKFRYRLPDPVGRTDIEYYRDPAHRGYLVHTVREGEGPSLFFKPPSEKTSIKTKEVKKKATVDNKLW